MPPGITLRRRDMIKLEAVTTKVSASVITIAGCRLTVTANAEQTPSACTVIGLLSEKGSVTSFLADAILAPSNCVKVIGICSRIFLNECFNAFGCHGRSGYSIDGGVIQRGTRL